MDNSDISIWNIDNTDTAKDDKDDLATASIEALRKELKISSEHDFRSWADIKRALAAFR